MTNACASLPSFLSRAPAHEAIGIAACLALFGASAHAGDFTIGLGAGVDRGRTDCIAAYPCEHNSTQAKLFGGYQFDQSFDLQAVYFDAGRFKGGDITPLGTNFGGDFRVSGFGLTGGYRWGFAPSWSLTGRAGVASVRTRFDYAAPFNGLASVSQTTTQPLLGVGIGYAVTPSWRLGVDYDATRFKVYQTRGSLQMLSVSAQYTF